MLHMLDRRETVVLLGAGASKEAGVPTTFEMTQQLVERVNSGQFSGHQVSAALNFVCGALLAHDAADGTNPFTTLDVERVFAAVELLAERSTLEVTPFVAAWNRAVDALDTRPSAATGNFNRRFRNALEEPDSMHGVERAIIDLIDARTGSGTTGETYRELAEIMLRDLRDLVATPPKASYYLDPLVNSGRGVHGLTIATLNYDLTVEQAAARSGVPCATGIEHWLRFGRWDWPGSGIRLLKLHGSIDWVWDRPVHEDGHLPRRVMRVVADPQAERETPAIVFGQRGKLRTEGPFLGLLAELESLMGKAKHLVVIGYSFRDEHVNELIQRWTLEDRERTILVVDPGWPARFNYAMREDFRMKLDHYLLPHDLAGQADFEPRLDIRVETCSTALHNIFSAQRLET